MTPRLYLLSAFAHLVYLGVGLILLASFCGTWVGGVGLFAVIWGSYWLGRLDGSVEPP